MSPASAPDELDGIILAGGRAERLGGASKPDLVIGGRSLLSTAIEAARAAGCERIIVVGPPELDAPGCTVVRESPPFGGPVAAVAAGLAALPSAGRGAPGEAGRVSRPATLSGADRRTAEKELSAVERRMAKVADAISAKHDAFATADQSDYAGLQRLQRELSELDTEAAQLEDRWLELSEQLEG
jgi:hypothetical protein